MATSPNRQTTARARGDDGSELVVHDSQTDAPIIPIGALERLHEIRPDKVDWVFEQSAMEAQARRNEQRRVNTLEFLAGIGLGRLTTVVHAHPTGGEAIKSAGEAYLRTCVPGFFARLALAWAKL
jgi:hypothetical protein